MTSTIESTQNLVVAQWNCNSAKAHNSEIASLLSKHHINILCLNETKLQPCTNIEFDGYHTERKDHNSRGGGVAILIHNDIHYERLNTLDHYNLELVLFKVITNYKTLHLITIYVPPRKSVTDDFLCQNFFDDLDKLRPFILNSNQQR